MGAFSVNTGGGSGVVDISRIEYIGDIWSDEFVGVATGNISKHDMVIGLKARPDDTFTKLANPATLPAGSGNGCAFSPDSVHLAVAQTNSPFVTIYKCDDDVFTNVPYPATLPAGQGNDCAFSPDGGYLAVAHNISPFITIYKREGDTFTKLPNPAALPAGIGNGCMFSPDSLHLAVAHDNSPYITIYKREGDTFTKLPNPASLPSAQGYDCAFSPDGGYLAVAINTTNATTASLISLYKRDGDTFTRITDPISTNQGGSMGAIVGARTCTFSPDSMILATSHLSNGFVAFFKRFYDSDIFKRIEPPEDLPASWIRGITYTSNGTHFALAHNNTPWVSIYKYYGDGFYKIDNPSALPTGWGQDCEFSPDDKYLAIAHNNTPYITIYKTSQIPNQIRSVVLPRDRFIMDNPYAIGLGFALEDAAAGESVTMSVLKRLG